jgi:hypothetical protein
MMALCVACGVQGIKFYDPEIVGDTPEAVEFKGLQNVVDMVAQQLGLEQGKVRHQGLLTSAALLHAERAAQGVAHLSCVASLSPVQAVCWGLLHTVGVACCISWV